MGAASDVPPEARAFIDGLPFAPDRFQTDAIAIVAEGTSLVVAAPTGAGKTLIAEAGVHMALAGGLRTFYTTPIKALSNQKYTDFREVHGPDRVGLLTGDNVINGDAPVVVMTTEVLRNMIYADSRALESLGLVVLDEVHYLQDQARGQVWEEVIIHLPAGIPLLCLSATISNAEEFTSWVTSRRGETELVVESTRPVPLESLYLLKDRNKERGLDLLPLFGSQRSKPNKELDRLLKRGRGRRRRFVAPRRLETVEELARDRLLPAIYFIFSRAGCDQAASLVSDARLGLVGSEERKEIRRIAARRTSHLPASDLGVLGYATFAANLDEGVAAHHAGMVPAFKEAVEELFAAGLVKVVFATETLALGINMPARTVVLERMSKFTGETHELLAPGDYTQLTGRAGRRGIDAEGTAVVLHDWDLPLERVAAIAASGSHPLRSSFAPTYNMAVNLVAGYARERAEELLHASFAQFRAETRRTQIEARVQERKRDRDEFRASASCDRGDIWEFVTATGGPGAAAQELRDFAQGALEGDVWSLTGEEHDRWVVLARSWGPSPRFLLLGADGETRRVRADQLPLAVARLGAMPLTEPVRTRDASYQRRTVRALSDWDPGPGVPARPGLVGDRDPVAGCPELGDHLVWVKRAADVEKEIRRLERRLSRQPRDVVSRFRSYMRVLGEWGYVDGWRLTSRGERLRFVYNELDVVVAAAVERGLFDDLSVAEAAALASLFTFEARRVDAAGDWPTATVAERGTAVFELHDQLVELEHRLRIPETRPPDPGFAEIIHGWAGGADLADLFTEDHSAGDFVRNCRQLLDLLRQLRDGYPSLAPAMRDAIKSIDRGVVAVGGRL
ncbi:MAG: DEAD/DEAH box helicase [Acidimicrobiia bacterium]